MYSRTRRPPRHSRLGRILGFFLLVNIIIVFCYLVILSPPVQRLFYPIPHQEYVFRYSQTYQVDPYLVAAVIRAESRFSHTAESGSGARGLMQIMPETAKWAAEQLEMDYHQEMLFDPQYNIRIGCWYLRKLQDNFKGNLVVVLAAYNGGQGNVGRWLEEGVWDGELDHLSQIPFPETRVYVQKVLRYYQRYQELYEEREVP